MNYLQARQRQTDTRWDFTSMNDNIVHPIGYCHAYHELDGTLYPITEEQQTEHRQHQTKYHTDGHATAAEAEQCYKQYLLDRHLKLAQTLIDEQRKCQICHTWTSQYATIDNSCLYVLCPEHNNRTTVDALYEAPSHLWTS